jgi:thiamine pyrophosphokinase
MQHTVIVSNGTYPVPVGLITSETTLVIADGGLARVMLSLTDIPPGAVLVGDLDSADPADVIAWEAQGGLVDRHPVDKDATDLELALQRVIDEPGPLTIVGGDGLGRFDHLLGEISLLASAGRRLTAYYGTARVELLTTDTGVALTGQPGEIVSILPWSSSIKGVYTKGLRWPLADAVIGVGSTRGISNEFTDSEASVSIGVGIAIVIQPTAYPPQTSQDTK